jgi:hypothetical protein
MVGEKTCGMSKHTSGNRISGFVGGLNRSLLPIMGPAQLGDPNEPLVVPPPHGGSCPLCGLPMDEHILERSQRDTYLICPEVEAKEG